MHDCNVSSGVPRAAGAVVLALLALGAVAAPALAQYGDPYNRVVLSIAPSVYWGYTYDPYGGYLHGAADLVRAQGDFLIKREQAALERERVRRAKLETRHLQLEHWEWEREFLAGAGERQRERVRKAEVERGRNFPPLTEILAAIPLNNLLDDLIKQPQLPLAGSVAVQPEWLAHVHVTVDGRGNIGLLKEDTLYWPQLLLRSDFAAERERIDQLFTQAKEQTLSTRRDPALLLQLRRRVAACQEHIRSETKRGTNDADWSPRHYIDAKRFLGEVDGALMVLERPDAAYYLSPLQGNTVAEVVASMKKSGIRFAPATVGCERFYVALHRALADEVTRLHHK
jgi:hypothetical protein